jgi:hypothetical protein
MRFRLVVDDVTIQFRLRSNASAEATNPVGDVHWKTIRGKETLVPEQKIMISHRD